MIERDYLMRMIDLLVKALAQILLHKKTYDYPMALKEIDSSCKSLLGMNREFIRNFSDVQLIELFERDIEASGVKCYVLGMLLNQEAEILQLQGNQSEGLALSTKSLSLLLSSFLNSGAPVESDHTALIEETMGRLGGCELPPHIKEKIFVYEEFAGRFDKAEDLLYELLESDVRYIVIGRQFYQRLLGKSDADLLSGNLPREEVQDGLLRLDTIESHGKGP